MMVSSVMQVIGRSAGEATSSRGSSDSSFIRAVSSVAQSAAAAALPMSATSAMQPATTGRKLDPTRTGTPRSPIVWRANVGTGTLAGRHALPAPGLDLVDRIDHGIERQEGGGVARLVIAHRLEHG